MVEEKNKVIDLEQLLTFIQTEIDTATNKLKQASAEQELKEKELKELFINKKHDQSATGFQTLLEKLIDNSRLEGKLMQLVELENILLLLKEKK